MWCGLDNIAVKGKTVGLDIYTVGKTIKHKHEEYKKEYIRGNWKKAITWAKELEADPKVTVKEYYHKMIDVWKMVYQQIGQEHT
jgi:hypothetical protein